MKRNLLTAAILLLISTTLSAQFVGDGTPKPPSPTGPSSTKPSFTMKFGTAMPRANFGTIPLRNNTPQYAAGTMGAKSGFFVEMGMGMNMTNPDKKVGFYYYPILAAYWQSSMDWGKLGAPFTDKAMYTKPIRAIEVAQRYGIYFKPPVKDLSVALYYRPAGIIPLGFEMTHTDVTKGEKFLFTGEMSSEKGAPVFMMSHTPGIAVRYMFATLSIESYNAKPTFAVHYQDVDASPLMNFEVTKSSKIPVKMLIISLALSF